MINIKIIKEYQKKMEEVKKSDFKANDFKELGRELRDNHNSPDREAIDILNNNAEEILNILDKYS